MSILLLHLYLIYLKFWVLVLSVPLTSAKSCIMDLFGILSVEASSTTTVYVWKSLSCWIPVCLCYFPVSILLSQFMEFVFILQMKKHMEHQVTWPLPCTWFSLIYYVASVGLLTILVQESQSITLLFLPASFPHSP